MTDSDIFTESLNDIFDHAINEHDRSIINGFKKLAEDLKGHKEPMNYSYNEGEVAGVEYCIYILESLIERRRKEREADHE